MRNIIEYPITLDELQQSLDHARELHNAQGIQFNTYGLCYHLLMHYIVENPEAIEAFLARAHAKQYALGSLLQSE